MGWILAVGLLMVAAMATFGIAVQIATTRLGDDEREPVVPNDAHRPVWK